MEEGYEKFQPPPPLLSPKSNETIQPIEREMEEPREGDQS